MVALALGSGALQAQVGYDPHSSPYRDLRQTQELTAFSGYFRAKADPARVAPQSGPIIGVLYQWRPSGPMHLNASFSRVSSQRRVLDPDLPGTCTGVPAGDCKLIDTFRWPLYFIDGGLALSLTGARSFYHLMPEIKLGAGAATDFHTQPDVGDFAFGTRFAFNWGAGIRWVPGGALQVRADLSNHLYAIKYPRTYYVAAPDQSVIFTNKQSQTAWLNNPSFTLGFSYLFPR
jgi:hypothetical protein